MLVSKKTNNEKGFFLNDPSSSKGVNDVWEDLFTPWNMNAVYKEINKQNKPYSDFSFMLYAIEVPPKIINLKRGYLIPSSKLVKTPGTAHGLVLDKNGNCIGYSKIAIE